MEGGVDLAREKPLLGWGSGSFNAEYRSHETQLGARGDGGVAHDPDHGRRRAGHHRARGLRGAARRWRSCGCCSGARGVAGAGGDRRRLRRARAAHVALRGLPRGPGDVDAARARHRAGVPAEPRPRADDEDAAAALNGHRREPVVVARPVPRGGKPLRAAGRARRQRRSRSPSRCSSGRSRAPIRTTTPTTTWSGAGQLLDGLGADVHGLRRPDPASALRGARRRPRRGSSARARTACSCSCACSRTRSSCSAPTGSARRSSAAGAGALAALFVAASASFLLYAARGYVDAPFLALVVWAGVLRRPRVALRGHCSCWRACCALRRGC